VGSAASRPPTSAPGSSPTSALPRGPAPPHRREHPIARAGLATVAFTVPRAREHTDRQGGNTRLNGQTLTARGL
jgi:hypothetical protein